MKCVLLVSLLSVALALLGGVTAAPPGGGGRNCVCPTVFQPVCGPDGRIYENQCRLECVFGRWVWGYPPVNGTCYGFYHHKHANAKSNAYANA